MTTWIKELQERAREQAGKIVLTPEHDGYSFTPNALDCIVATTALRTLDFIQNSPDIELTEDSYDYLTKLKVELTTNE